jgi:hypothetical protein
MKNSAGNLLYIDNEWFVGKKFQISKFKKNHTVKIKLR